MKAIVILFAFIMITSYIYSQDASAYTIDDSLKEKEQFTMAAFLSGFVGIYGITIYWQKKNDFERIKENISN